MVDAVGLGLAELALADNGHIGGGHMLKQPADAAADKFQDFVLGALTLLQNGLVFDQLDVPKFIVQALVLEIALKGDLAHIGLFAHRVHVKIVF